MNEFKENKQTAAMKIDWRAQCQMREQIAALCADKRDFYATLVQLCGLKRFRNATNERKRERDLEELRESERER